MTIKLPLRSKIQSGIEQIDEKNSVNFKQTTVLASCNNETENIVTTEECKMSLGRKFGKKNWTER